MRYSYRPTAINTSFVIQRDFVLVNLSVFLLPSVVPFAPHSLRDHLLGPWTSADSALSNKSPVVHWPRTLKSPVGLLHRNALECPNIATKWAAQANSEAQHTIWHQNCSLRWLHYAMQAWSLALHDATAHNTLFSQIICLALVIGQICSPNVAKQSHGNFFNVSCLCVCVYVSVRVGT